MRKKVSRKARRSVRAKVKPIVILKDGTIAPEEFTEEKLAYFRGWQPITQVTGKDIEESARVGRVIGAIPNGCWRNALRVVRRLDEYADASYVEGIACLNGMQPIEHGWVCRSDGTIIDPTLPRHGGVYFPGLEFKGWEEIEEFLSTPQGRGHETPPFFFAFEWGGRNCPGMSQALEQGWAYVRERYPEALSEYDFSDFWKVDGEGNPFLHIQEYLIKIKNLQMVISCDGENDFCIEEKCATLEAAKERAEFIMSELLKDVTMNAAEDDIQS